MSNVKPMSSLSEIAQLTEALQLFHRLPPAKKAVFMEFVRAATGKHGAEFDAILAEYEPRLKAAGDRPDA